MKYPACIVLVFFGIAILFFTVPIAGVGQNSGNEFPSISGQVSGTGTFFEITDSNYLNITLESTVPIEATVNSTPNVVSIVIQSSPAVFTQLTLSGLIPNKTYYRYDNSFQNETVFVVDNTGSFTFIQDMAQGHHIWVQEKSGTLFIPADCHTVGTFDTPTSTCTLNQDISDNIEITASGVTLDCDGRQLSDGFAWTSFAILLNNRNNVTVKNCTIINATNGIAAVFSDSNMFINNSMNGNNTGILLVSSDGNTVSDTTSTNNGQGIALNSFSQNNTVINNNLSDLLFGVTLNQSQSNTIKDNAIDGHSSTGVHITALSISNNILDNIISNNAFGIFLLNTLTGTGNTIRDNTIRNSANSGITVGINSPNTRVFNNNFIDNAIHAQAFSVSSFDNGLPDGGNYWNTFDTPAEGCNDTNNDGLCDAPFLFLGGLDNLPWTTQDEWRGQKMIRPEEIGRIVKKFPSYPNHEGIDLLDADKVFGAPVKAAASGEILFAKRIPTPNGAAGKWVWIFHGDIRKLDGTIVQKISTRYLHLDTVAPSLAEGQNILVGTEIGTVGSTGTNIPHLHFEVRQGDIPPDKNFSKTDFLNPEEFVDYPLPPETLSIQALSPVDLIVTDPDGLIVSKTINELLPSASYFDVKYLEDLSEGEDILNYDLVVINKRKLGDYLITVVPEDDARATDTYSINAESANGTEILADNVLISDIPSQPYFLRSTDTKIEKIIPVTVRIEPETLNLSQRGIFTVSLQISKGFGVTVEDINTNTLILSGASPQKTNFNKGTNALNLKFNTKDLIDVLPGNKVTLLIKGQLFDGTKFEGSDTIRVIKKSNIFSTITNIFFTLTNLVANLFATFNLRL